MTSNKKYPIGVIVCALAMTPALAHAQATDAAKTCRMEQQCKWVDFKKVCYWVRVCR